MRVTDFGLSKISKDKTHSICVPEEHQVLTSAGFLDLDAFVARSVADPALLVAGYDLVARRLLWERPLGVIVFPRETRELVEFCEGDQEDWDGTLSYLATADHMAFVQPGRLDSCGAFVPDESGFAKHPAAELLGRAARHVAAAETCGESGSAGCAGAALGLPPARAAALLQLLGFWAGCGAARRPSDGRPELTGRDPAECTWLQQAAAVAGLDERLVWRLGDGLEDWLWQGTAAELREAQTGARRALGRTPLETGCAALRNSLTRLAVVAGEAVVARPVPGGWSVSLAESSQRRPVAQRVRVQRATGRVWCLRMPSGLFWVRRADGRGRAGRAAVTGNCGTPQFLAPEMILYAKTTGYNVMVDWWALGVVIHEMASCQLPFDDENHQQLYRKIVYEQPLFPSYFSGELSSLLEGLLTKDPSRRLGVSVDDIKVRRDSPCAFLLLTAVCRTTPFSRASIGPSSRPRSWSRPLCPSSRSPLTRPTFTRASPRRTRRTAWRSSA